MGSWFRWVPGIGSAGFRPQTRPNPVKPKRGSARPHGRADGHKYPLALSLSTWRSISSAMSMPYISSITNIIDVAV